MIRARVGGGRKYRKYRRIRVRLVGISYEVVLLLVLLRLRERWRGEREKRRGSIGKYKQRLKGEEGRRGGGEIE